MNSLSDISKACPLYYGLSPVWHLCSASHPTDTSSAPARGLCHIYLLLLTSARLIP